MQKVRSRSNCRSHKQSLVLARANNCKLERAAIALTGKKGDLSGIASGEKRSNMIVFGKRMQTDCQTGSHKSKSALVRVFHLNLYKSANRNIWKQQFACVWSRRGQASARGRNRSTRQLIGLDRCPCHLVSEARMKHLSWLEETRSFLRCEWAGYKDPKWAIIVSVHHVRLEANKLVARGRRCNRCYFWPLIGFGGGG